MKKIVVAALSLAMVFVGTSCGGPHGQSSEAQGGDEQVEISTGSTGGSFNQLGIGWGQIIGEHTDYTATVVSSAGAVENIRNVSAGVSDVGVSFSNQLYQAYAGTGYFSNEQYGDLRAICTYPNAGAYQIAVKSASGMKYISDVKGHKVSVGAPGSGGEVLFTELLEDYFRFERDKDYNRELISGTTASDALKNDQIDAYCLFMPAPVSLVMDIAATEQIALLTMDEDVAAEIVADNPGLYIDSFKAGCYTGVDEDVPAVLSCGTWFVSKDASEDMVYRITQALYENLEEFYTCHATASAINFDTALENCPIPMHSGAVKYFTEKGLTVPAELIVD